MASSKSSPEPSKSSTRIPLHGDRIHPNIPYHIQSQDDVFKNNPKSGRGRTDKTYIQKTREESKHGDFVELVKDVT